MRSKLFVGLVAAFLATAGLGLASHGSHKKPERNKNVTFVDTLTLNNGTTLKAGTYQMEVAENSQSPDVAFYQNGKVVATTHAKLVTEQKKNSDTEVDYTKQGREELLTEIRPGGWEEALIFGSAGGSMHTGK